MNSVWRIGLACVNRPYIGRSIFSIVKGTNGFSKPFTIELFDGLASYYYLKPYKDKFPSLVIHCDGVKRNVVLNFWWLWSTISRNTIWSMMFPDDFVVCRDFLKYADYFCNKYKDKYDIFSFWTPYKDICEEYNKGEDHWVIPKLKFWGGIGLAMKSEVMRELARYVKEKGLYNLKKQGDMIINKFSAETNRPILACVPNLCDHTGIVSTVFHRWAGFKTPCFIGEDKSPYDILS